MTPCFHCGTREGTYTVAESFKGGSIFFYVCQEHYEQMTGTRPPDNDYRLGDLRTIWSVLT